MCTPHTHTATHGHTCACKHMHALLHTDSGTSIYETLPHSKHTRSDTHTHTHAHSHTLVPPNLSRRRYNPAFAGDNMVPTHDLQFTAQTHTHACSPSTSKLTNASTCHPMRVNTSVSPVTLSEHKHMLAHLFPFSAHLGAPGTCLDWLLSGGWGTGWRGGGRRGCGEGRHPAAGPGTAAGDSGGKPGGE